MFMRSPFPCSFPSQKHRVWLISSDETARQGSIVDRVAGKAAASQEWLGNSSRELELGNSTGGLCGPAVRGAILHGKARPAGCRRSHPDAGSKRSQSGTSND